MLLLKLALLRISAADGGILFPPAPLEATTHEGAGELEAGQPCRRCGVRVGCRLDFGNEESDA
ncbi:hypothetical protein [Tardiphaga sp.]|uniref:hypothetical protein n=1 Tax=Tardiphaga sp. TaxID=1926292 RepID=UPI002635116E|nr:hypothetical protein [Tardiphaga sp.]